MPGGKEELALAAIANAEQEMARFLEQVFARFDDPLDALAAWIDSALQRIAASRFKLGCPLAAAARSPGVDPPSRLCVADSERPPRNATDAARRRALVAEREKPPERQQHKT